MKSFCLIALAAGLIVLAVVILGCDDLWSTGEDDSLYVSDVWLWVPPDTVIYSPGSAPEVSGHVDAWNRQNQLLGHVHLGLSVNDCNVSIVYADPLLRDTTDDDGRLNFSLRCQDCAGEVEVCVSYYPIHSSRQEFARLLFVPEDRQPVRIVTTTDPDTLYLDYHHAAMTAVRIEVLGQNDQPLSAINVYCDYLDGSPGKCEYVLQTGMDGVVTGHYVDWYSNPGRKCYPVRAGAVRDSVCYMVMTWDSTHGG
jgi:hypothetical protein